MYSRQVMLLSALTTLSTFATTRRKLFSTMTSGLFTDPLALLSTEPSLRPPKLISKRSLDLAAASQPSLGPPSPIDLTNTKIAVRIIIPAQIVAN